MQDFGGHDFNFIKNIVPASVNFLFVGDFYQHTFDTSRDGSVNKSLHNNYSNYIKLFKSMGLTIDTGSLIKSHRCSPSVCQFISNEIGISMESHRKDETAVEIVTDSNVAINIFNDDSIVKLFFQDQRKYTCFSKNWGECKGEDKYQNVCVVLYKKSWINLENGTLRSLPASSKNKLYVACSRAKGNLFLVNEDNVKAFKAK